ncbi:uncharacterized protein LOC128856514 [Anastrepha ludens]|uniref:uncharacterized protein LOC128856514 n=1 Tax=Anastrepha ludens TaxID=28586 RepID=UPI0023B1699F|nr:uncharacterized protein LOC128856514 [Anastrepha ludens]
MNVGAHQGTTLSPLILNLVIDTLTRKLQDTLPWTLLYADDDAQLSENADALQNKLSQWAEVLETNGSRMSTQKTEHVTFTFIDSDQIPKFHSAAETVSMSENFNYLGFIVSDDGSLDREVTNRIQAGWQSWRAVSVRNRAKNPCGDDDENAAMGIGRNETGQKKL